MGNSLGLEDRFSKVQVPRGPKLNQVLGSWALSRVFRLFERARYSTTFSSIASNDRLPAFLERGLAGESSTSEEEAW